VRIDQPELGATLNSAALADVAQATVPRLAATVILVRGGSERLELLLVRRSPAATLMRGTWVFPGGSVDSNEGTGETGLRAAARRELREEAGIALPADAELLAFARWITPPEIERRYDTWFFVAAAPRDVQPHVDGNEIVAARWLSPAGALAAAATGELVLVFPTIRQLHELSRFASSSELLRGARGREPAPVQPRVILTGGRPRIVLPGDPGYQH
jgi:8-oxo-dGTP pyrophosphatase MutT (NUDIX family)